MIRSRCAAGAVALSTLLLGACKNSPPNEPAALYQMACDYVRSAKGGQLVCVRLNTSTGDAKLIQTEQVKSSGASAAMDPAGPGAYQLECRTVHGMSDDAFTCLRMDRRTGELVALSLKDIGSIR